MGSGDRPENNGRFRAIVFDGLALLDTRPIGLLAQRLFPEHGTELAELWRVKSLEYQWLSALSRRVTDFWRCTDAALRHAAATLKLELGSESGDRLMRAWLELRAWPDVAPALHALKVSGRRLAPLANLSTAVLEGGIERSGLGGLFDEILSTERIGSFKPDPRAYALALEALGVHRSETLFVPSASWDALGAAWFGYPTCWVNRSGAVAEGLGPGGIPTVTGMADLLRFVGVGGSAG